MVEACLETVLDSPGNSNDNIGKTSLQNTKIKPTTERSNVVTHLENLPPYTSLLQGALQSSKDYSHLPFTPSMNERGESTTTTPFEAVLTPSGVQGVVQVTPRRLPAVPTFYDRSRDLKTKPHKCTCGRAYRYKRGLSAHQKYECGRSEKAFTCFECDKKFTHQSSLNSHVRFIHKGEETE